MRRLATETAVSSDDLILPMFIVNGQGKSEQVPSMPGVKRVSPDLATEHAHYAFEAGVHAILLFGLPKKKDALGTSAFEPDEAVQQACTQIKRTSSDTLVITDACLCEYTDHGQCSIIDEDGQSDNDTTLEILAKVALSHAQAGADMIAPSGMMDGQVSTIRQVLDSGGFAKTSIMSYSSKYASSYYGPFRNAAGSNFSGIRSYQISPAQSDEAIREMEADVAEGADWLMVKPALTSLDILQRAADIFLHPIAAYSVSGEYSMIKAAAERGWIEEHKIVIENLTTMKRAGARAIITYHAVQAAKWLAKG